MAYSSSLQVRRPEQLYFAFGSNLHLGQMAERCPGSRYIGTADLRGYRFQINQRGFANVVPSPGDHVEGLVYLLSQNDEERLDRSEGVPTAYQKYCIDVQVSAATIANVGRAVPELVQQLTRLEHRLTHSEAPARPAGSSGRSRSNSNPSSDHNRGVRPFSFWRQITGDSRQRIAHQQDNVYNETGTPTEVSGSRVHRSHCTYIQSAMALVYMSENFQEDGKPRNEYIDRMNAGIIDARKLGISEKYIAECLRNYIVNRQLPKQSRSNSPENSFTGKPSRTERVSKTVISSAQLTEYMVERQPRFASSENSSNLDVEQCYPDGRVKEKSIPPQSSATNAGDNRGNPQKLGRYL